MRLRPRYNNVIIKPLEEHNQTDSGLIIPATALDNRPVKKGEVVEVGVGKPDAPIKDLTKGDKVLYANGSGIEIEFNKEKVIIMKDVDLPIVIED